ncbi:MAG: hypothetical protein R3F54_23515 [Alphaproteobacteria bacterium]
MVAMLRSFLNRNPSGRSRIAIASLTPDLQHRRLRADRRLSGKSTIPAIEQHDGAIRPEGAAIENEAFHLLQEGMIATAGDMTGRLAFGTGSVGAKPAEIAIAARLEHEHIDLMMGNADLACAVELRQDLPAKPIEPWQLVQAGEPERQVDVLAFMPELDPSSAIRGESRHLLPQRLCDRADQRDAHHRGELRPSVRQRIGSQAKLLMAQGQKTIVLVDPLL